MFRKPLGDNLPVTEFVWRFIADESYVMVIGEFGELLEDMFRVEFVEDLVGVVEDVSPVVTCSFDMVEDFLGWEQGRI